MDICPKCGTKSKGGHLCAACTGELHPERKMRPIRFSACSSCRRIQMRGNWKDISLDDAVRDAVHEALVGKRIRKIIFDQGAISWGSGKAQELAILVTINKNEIVEVPLQLLMTTCQACARRGGQYFEGVLQLRNPSREAINRLYTHVGALADRGVFINRESKEKNGVDFYLTSQKHLQTIAKKLQKEFGGNLSASAQLFTRDRQTSKDVFRVNVVLTLPPFTKGDVVLIHDRPVYVTSMGKSVSGIDVTNRKRVSIDSKQLSDAGVLKKRRAKVLTTRPEPTVLHPDTFEPIQLVMQGLVKKDQNVKIILWKDRAYAL